MFEEILMRLVPRPIIRWVLRRWREVFPHLALLKRNVMVTGYVRDDIESGGIDGDVTFGLYPTAQFRYMLNELNYSKFAGALHCEIEPEDAGTIKVPEPGSFVEVWGDWVNDIPHGHNEIHPVRKIKV